MSTVNIKLVHSTLLDGAPWPGEEDGMKQVMQFMQDTCLTLNDSKSSSIASNKTKMQEVLKRYADKEIIYQLLSQLHCHNDHCRTALLLIYTQVFRLDVTKEMFVDSVLAHWDIVTRLVDGCGDKQRWSYSGTFLREVIRDPRITAKILENETIMEKLVSYVETSAFDISANALDTVTLLLKKHLKISSKFLADHFEAVNVMLRTLLDSPNYVTKLQSLNLLASILLERANFAFMIKYIDDVQSLELILDLFLESAKQQKMKAGAFAVLKVFIGNPKKTEATCKLLMEEMDELYETVEVYAPSNASAKLATDKKRMLAKLDLLKKQDSFLAELNEKKEASPNAIHKTKSSSTLSTGERKSKPLKSMPGSSMTSPQKVVSLNNMVFSSKSASI